MKINTLTIKQIIKEELDSFIKEFKMPDIIPTPEDVGIKRITFDPFDPSIEAKVKQILNNVVDVKGLVNFLEQNSLMEALTLKESIEKSLPQRKRAAGEIIAENVRIMKADRMWQQNFGQNIQELIQISKEDPSQRELIDEWVKIFITEKSKTWLDRNKETIKEFVRNNLQQLEQFIEKGRDKWIDLIDEGGLKGGIAMILSSTLILAMFGGMIVGTSHVLSKLPIEAGFFVVAITLFTGLMWAVTASAKMKREGEFFSWMRDNEDYENN